MDRDHLEEGALLRWNRSAALVEWRTPPALSPTASGQRDLHTVYVRFELLEAGGFELLGATLPGCWKGRRIASSYERIFDKMAGRHRTKITRCEISFNAMKSLTTYSDLARSTLVAGDLCGSAPFLRW